MTDVTEIYGTQPRLVGDRYELGSAIGFGGMAEVYRGRDVRLGREVAVKVLRSDLARDPNFLKRFQREAQSAAGLNHPAIVAVYDTGEDVINGVRLPYIVMEFVEGRTLREVLQREGRFSERRAMEIVSDICSALDYSHRLGIIHRDIKPANVMLSPDGSVKVMDFGIAKANNATSSTMTATSAVIGTAQYLSPEQARGLRVDARSDVYSTGVLLYELLTGEPPFRGDNPVAVAYQHVRELPEPPSRHEPSLSPNADAITLKALEKDPNDRYATANEMREDLERALAGRRVLARPTRSVGGPVAAGAGGTALTQVAPGGYRDDFNDGYDATGPYQQTAYQEPGYGGYGDPYYDDPRATRTTGYDRYDDYLDPADDDPYGAGAPGGPPPGQPQRTGSAAWKWVLGVLAVVLTFVVVSLVASSLLNSGDGGDGGGGGEVTQITIPPVVGQPVTTAEARLRSEGFTGEIKKVAEESLEPENEVLRIEPAEGQTVAADTVITLTYASPPGNVPIPQDLVGKPQDAARTQLESLGFQVDVQTYTEPTNVQPGRVAQSDPAPGAAAPRGSTVKIYVVSNTVTATDQTGRPVDAARSALERLGLRVQIQEQLRLDQPDGTVIDQDPKDETVERGTTVTLVVARSLMQTPSTSTSPSPTATQSQTPSLPTLPTGGGGGGGTGGGGGGGGTGGGGDGGEDGE
ncbi:MAG: Stk1 family PASTA domain-containing Ser/Thr kinase [Frankia sp.]|nr:Stk1 family PASTA domain-containing Ser/Thr kinase [Frankia sp.]